MSKERKKKTSNKITNDGLQESNEQLDLYSLLYNIPQISGKSTILIIIISLATIVIVSILTYNETLEGLKFWLIKYYDFFNPTRITKGCTDISAVLIAFTTLIGLTIINPLLGICEIIFIRCWLDGYTYPTDNIYFVWGTVIIGTIYFFRTFMKNDHISINAPLLFLIILILIMIVTLPYSYQLGRSIRQIILWCSYLILFLVLLNSIKNVTQYRLVQWTLLITLGLQSWYAYFHFHYVLPYLRKTLALSPALRIRFFGTADLSPELIYRFNINRAFGTMLFPNALAGFIILLLPICIYGVLYYQNKTIISWKSKKGSSLTKQQERWLLVHTALVWLISTIMIYATELYPLTYSLESNSSVDMFISAGIAVLLSIIPAGLFAWISIYKGRDTALYALITTCLVFCTIFAILSLYLTYSRGAWLSIMLSIFIILLLLFTSKIKFPQKKPMKIVFISLLLATIFPLIFLCSIEKINAESVIPNVTQEQTDTSQIAAQEILEKGVGVSFKQLRDPASFRLRIGYWKVGLSIFFHHLLTGVGIGNFSLAYPHYQFLGAGDVKECHNSYIQMFSETGLFGGIAFAFFVFCIILNIHKSVLTNSKENIAWGIGILAFLIHAGLDIHFSHPSLITYYIVTISLFLYKLKDEGKKPNFFTNLNLIHLSSNTVITAVSLILLCELSLLAYKPYIRDLVRSRMAFLNVGRDTDIPVAIRTLNYVFTDALNYVLNKTDNQPKMSATILRHFLPDLNQIKDFGPVYVPEGKGSNKAVLLPEGEPIPENGVLLLKRNWNFIGKIRSMGMRYAFEYLEWVDDLFPYQEDLPTYLQEIYRLIFQYSYEEYNPRIAQITRGKMLYWAEEALRRCPKHGDLYLNYGRCLWLAGVKDCPDKNIKLERIYKGLEYIEQSAKVWRLLPYYWDQYIEHLNATKSHFEKEGLTGEIEKINEKINYAKETVTKLREERAKLNLW